MNVKDTVRQSLLTYPNIHKNALDVYHHLFCSIGGGYEWKDGELVDPCKSKLKSPFNIKKAIDFVIDREKTHSGSPFVEYELKERIFGESNKEPITKRELEEFINKIILENNNLILSSLKYQVKSILDIDDRMNDFTPYDHSDIIREQIGSKTPKKKFKDMMFHDDKSSWKIYPMCIDYSHICNFPDDIKVDWLLAIDKMCWFVHTHRNLLRDDNKNEAQRCLDKAYERMSQIIKNHIDKYLNEANRESMRFLAEFTHNTQQDSYYTETYHKIENKKDE